MNKQISGSIEKPIATSTYILHCIVGCNVLTFFLPNIVEQLKEFQPLCFKKELVKGKEVIQKRS